MKSKIISIYAPHVVYNKYVFNLLLNIVSEEAIFILTGRALYIVGATFWNDMSPAHLSNLSELPAGVDHYILTAWVHFIWTSNWVRYNGTILLKALQVSLTLNSISSGMGSQWKWQMNGHSHVHNTHGIPRGGHFHTKMGTGERMEITGLYTCVEPFYPWKYILCGNIYLKNIPFVGTFI